MSYAQGMRHAVLLGFTLLLGGCSSTQFFIANAPTTFDRIDVHRDLPYAAGPRHELDVYSPRQATDRPVVVFWYGGSWVKGSKGDYRFVGTTLAEHGIVAVLPDYRLYPQVTFPAFDEDGARAVAWVERHVRSFGGDPRHLVLMGHSAGGHTAAFLAFNHEFLRRFGADPRDIVGLVGLSGTYVLEPEPGTERATFPAPYTESDWQPIRFVDSHAPPTLLLHGTKDKEVLPQEAIELRDLMLREHLRVELHLYEHKGHGDTVAPFAPVAHWRSPAVEDVLAFVHSVAGGRGPQQAQR
ncbi:MAG TPA: alpha/beta hydrolase [Steroidobacteraceae bacterium]|nr:alpha/beta hydrolase [Steroidobacteraceae bacterium]